MFPILRVTFQRLVLSCLYLQQVTCVTSIFIFLLLFVYFQCWHCLYSQLFSCTSLSAHVSVACVLVTELDFVDVTMCTCVHTHVCYFTPSNCQPGSLSKVTWGPACFLESLFMFHRGRYTNDLKWIIPHKWERYLNCLSHKAHFASFIGCTCKFLVVRNLS